MSFTTEHELTTDLQELEQQLAGLVPCAMPEELLSRLEQSMNHLVTDEATEVGSLDGDLGQLEEHLEQMAPASMPMDILGRMVSAMDRWHEHVPVEEKIVPFGGDDVKTPARKQFGGGMLAAAAAVAMLGAISALVLPRFFTATENNVVVTDTPTLDSDHAVTAVVAPRDAWLVPDSLSHKVTNTSDGGVIMTRDNTPHRCIRVDYVDRIKVQDEEGREIEIARPGVNFVLLPVETN